MNFSVCFIDRVIIGIYSRKKVKYEFYFKVNSPLTPTTSKTSSNSVNSPQSSFSLLDEASQDSNNLWDKPDYVVLFISHTKINRF